MAPLEHHPGLRAQPQGIENVRAVLDAGSQIPVALALRPLRHPDRFCPYAREDAQLPVALVPIAPRLVPVIVHSPDADVVQQMSSLFESCVVPSISGDRPRSQDIREDIDGPFHVAVGREQGV